MEKKFDKKVNALLKDLDDPAKVALKDEIEKLVSGRVEKTVKKQVKKEVKRKMKIRRKKFIRRALFLGLLAGFGYFAYTHSDNVKAKVNGLTNKIDKDQIKAKALGAVKTTKKKITCFGCKKKAAEPEVIEVVEEAVEA